MTWLLFFRLGLLGLFISQPFILMWLAGLVRDVRRNQVEMRDFMQTWGERIQTRVVFTGGAEDVKLRAALTKVGV